jgi:ABC-type sugar transport system permease subunit
VTPQPFLRAFVSPAVLCAAGFLAAMAAVLQFSLRAFVPGSLEPGAFTLDNFTALAKPLYARVFIDTVGICLITAFATLLVGYPLAYALVRTRNTIVKSAILVIVVTPLFLGEVVRTYSWIVVLGNNGFVNAVLLGLGVIERPLQLMFTTFRRRACRCGGLPRRSPMTTSAPDSAMASSSPPGRRRSRSWSARRSRLRSSATPSTSSTRSRRSCSPRWWCRISPSGSAS